MLKLEQQIIENWKDLFGQYFSDTNFAQANSTLFSINWEKLANIELSSYVEVGDALLLVQVGANQSLLSNYANRNIDSLIARAEHIQNDVFKTVALGALYYATQEKKDADQANLFKLAYILKRHFKTVEHSTRDFSRRKVYLHRYVCTGNIELISRLCKKHHKSRRPRENGYLIKNKKYDEYLYVVASEIGQVWKTTPSDVDKSSYRGIFTYIPKNLMNAQGKWTLQFENDHFWVKDGYFGNTYLGTSSAQGLHGRVYEKPDLKEAIRIIPSNVDNESCYIENYSTHRRIYAGGNEDTLRRAVYIAQEHAQGDDSYLWIFSTYKSLP